MGFNFIKKGLVLGTAALCTSTLYVNSLQAAEGPPSPDYLQIIAQNTTSILEKVSTLPDYMNAMVQFALNMQKSDESASISEMQSNFANVGKMIVQDYLSQASLQGQLNLDVLGPKASKSLLPQANDLVYSTMLGQPFYTPDPRAKQNEPAPNAAYNYIKNASGISLEMDIPRPEWIGHEGEAYRGYYNTMTAIKSFNAYVLSTQLVDAQNGNGLTTSQLALVTQASNSEWIAQIATEEIGKVLRQLLIFQSQTYVLLTQMMQTQKQLLTAQVMTNSLLMAGNKLVDDRLYNAARTSKK